MTAANEQLLLDHMPRRLFVCTPSRLAAFDCPRRYRFSYLDRPTPQRGLPWAHNSLGSSVHLALSQWYLLPAQRRTPEAAEQLVIQNWQRNGYRDDEQAAMWLSHACAWVRSYVSSLDASVEPAGVERTVAFKTPALSVSGRVDRIDDRGDELVIVDYKTGRRDLTDDDARGSLALALYVLAVRRSLRRECTRVELHHIPTGTVSAHEHTDESLQRQVDRAQATADDIVTATDTLAAGADPDDVFPANPGPGCAWCDFRKHCVEGRAAASERQPWDGLAEPVAS